MTIPKQVIATSGGFAIEPQNKRIDRYILAQAPARRPKICFLGTASGDSKNFVQRFYNFFQKEDCVPSHLSLFKNNILDPERFLLNQDIIYVGGGNSRNMMAIWKDRGIDKILKVAYESGIVMTGISAGSLCWFEEGITDSLPGGFTAMDCLGLIKGSNCPFFSPEKDKTYRKLLKKGEIKPGYACEIGTGLHFIDGQLTQAFTSRKKAKTFLISLDGKRCQSKTLEMQYLSTTTNSAP